MRERPAGLAGFQARVDPGVIEEPLAHGSEFGTERRIGIQNLLRRVGPGDQPVVVVRQRGVAIPMLQLGQPQPLRLHQVIPVRQPGIGLRHRRHQRIDNLILHHVGAVAEAGRAGVTAPRVLDLLVLRQGVGNHRQQTQIVAERGANRLAGGLPNRTVTVGQLVQRVADRQLLAIQVDPHRGYGFVEQPHPSAIGGQVAFVGQFLQFVAQLVRPEHPQVAQPRPVARQGGVGEFRLQRRVVQAVQLQREEDQVAADRRHPLIHALIEPADGGVAGIAGEQQLGVGPDAPQQFLDTLILGDRGTKARTGQAGQRAGPGHREILRRLFGMVQVGLDPRIVRRGVQVRQIPCGQGLGLGGACVDHRGFHVLSLLHRLVM